MCLPALVVFLLCGLSFATAVSFRNGNITGVEQMLARILPASAAGQITLTLNPDTLDAASADTFTLANGPNDTIDVTSNTVSGLSMAIGWYLRHVVNCSVSWVGSNCHSVTSLPGLNSPIMLSSSVAWRYYFNERAHGYSTAYWSVEQWTYHLDWCVRFVKDSGLVLFNKLFIRMLFAGWPFTVLILHSSRLVR